MYRPYDISYDESIMPELRLWCLDTNSDPALIRVINFRLFVIRMLPLNYNWNNREIVNSYKNGLISRFKRKEDVIKKYFIDIIKVDPLCYHDPEINHHTEDGKVIHRSKSYAVKITVESHEEKRVVENMMKYPTKMFYKYKPYEVHTQICNNRIGTEWQILCNIGSEGLSYCQWFKSDKYYEPKVKISIVPEYIVDAKDMIPIDSDQRTTPMTMSFDGEMFSHNPKAFPSPHKPKDIAYLITASFKRIETNDKVKRVAILYGDCDTEAALTADDGSHIDAELIKVNSELEMLHEFQELIRKVNPIIITGYNIVGFDWLYLDGRYGLHDDNWENFSLMKDCETTMQKISWSSSAYGNIKIVFPYCPGRISIDVISHVKRNYKFPRYSLNYVSGRFLGDTKLDVTPKEMFAAVRALQNGEDDCMSKMARVVRYGIIDADLPLRLFEYFKMWTASVEMCNVVNVTPNNLLKTGQQKRVAAMLYKECNISNITMNYKVIGANGYEGGYVGKPIRGLHDNVIVLDFKSLYPSIMYMFNLCYSTYVPPEDVKKIKEEDKKYYHFITLGKIEGEDDVKNENEEDDDVKNNEVVTHVFHRNRIGVIPGIVSKLLNARGNVKKEMKSHPKDSEIYGVLNARQLAYKVSCNSIYGFLGVSEQKGILPLSPIARSTTYLGRDAILKTNAYIKKTWPGTQIIYNDTDSTMFTIDMSVDGSPQFEPTNENYEKFGEMVGDNVSKYLRNHYLGEEEATQRANQLGMLELEFEELVKRMFCIEKKNYVKVYEKNGKLDLNSMNYKGIMLARRTASNFARDIYKKILEMIVNGYSHDDVLYEMVNHIIRCRSRSIKIADLSENQSMGGSWKNKNYSMSIFSNNLANDGKTVTVGDRVDYVILKSIEDDNLISNNGKMYVGNKMRLVEQIDEMVKENKSFKIDTAYYSKSRIDNIDKLFSIAYKDEIERARDVARYRVETQHAGDEERIRILSEANYPDFRIRNSSYFTRINSNPLKNLNKIADLKDKILKQLLQRFN